MITGFINVDLASYYIDKALKINKKFYQGYVSRGVIHAENKLYSTAIADFSTALLLAPDYAEAHNNRGFAYLIRGKYPEALVDLENAKKLVTETTSANWGIDKAIEECRNEIGRK
jgi:Tfp pilus assembly protein PilF